MEQDDIDLLSLKALKIDPDMERVTRTCASIIVHAHAVARDPAARGNDARRIIELTRSLYAVMPSRSAIEDIVDDFLDDAGLRGRERRSIEDARAALVDRLWRQFHHGPDHVSLKA